MEGILEQSQEIYQRAIAQYPPYAIVLALSGGNDSLATYYVAKALGIKIDFILHCNTRTGIRQTTEFVRSFSEEVRIPYIEADAGDSYKNYVLRKGFYGRGTIAHTYTYHTLKHQHIRAALSQNIRHRRKGRNILILNGARILESDNRAKNFAGKEVRPDGKSKNIWVNLIHYWSKPQCTYFLNECKAPCNPVARELCRSGECFCGSMQSDQARLEASTLFPEWGAWLDALEAKVMQNFPWKWGQEIPRSWALEKQGQLRLFDQDFQPMCSSCKSRIPSNGSERHQESSHPNAPNPGWLA